MDRRIPVNYSTYYFSGAVTEGSMEMDPGNFILWHPDEIAQNNVDLQVKKYAPDFIAFGDNGANELLVFDNNGMVFMLPMIGMDPKDAIRVAGSWDELERHIRDTGKAE